MSARLAVVLAIVPAVAVAAEPAPSIEAVLAHPLFAEIYSCNEHPHGQLKSTGDALATDCYVERLVEEGGRAWLRQYRNSGLKNEDWFGWGVDVLSPCAGKVEKVRENAVTNEPGILGKPPASALVLSCDDGVHFVVAHIAAPVVAVGDSVAAGQKIAQVGNNGMSRHPHIHLGAWRGTEPLQVRFDQTKMGGE
jgi:hypothetical protein